MTDEQRQMLRDRLMEKCPEDPTILHEFDTMIAEDIRLIEPVIDAFIEAARAGAQPSNWQFNDASFEFVGDGVNMIVYIKFGARSFSCVMARESLKELGEMMIRESGV